MSFSARTALVEVFGCDFNQVTMKQKRNTECACGSGVKYKKCCLPGEREQAQRDAIEKKRIWLEKAELRSLAREHVVDRMRGLHPGARGSLMDPVTITLAEAIHGEQHVSVWEPKKSEDLLPASAVASAVARVEMNETWYRKLEEMFPVAPMTPEQVDVMNRSLGPGMSKDAAYRPYCVHDGCRDMPRMFRIDQGFKCWSCQNTIGFDLRRIELESAQTHRYWWIVSNPPGEDIHLQASTRPSGLTLGPYTSHDELMGAYSCSTEWTTQPKCELCGNARSQATQVEARPALTFVERSVWNSADGCAGDTLDY